MNERQQCDSEMCLEMLSWEAADHDSQPTACAMSISLSHLVAVTPLTDQFVQGFMDSLPQSSALETPEKFVNLCSL